jgi:bacillithiol biosynthesis cysteine-adding enzyme BshC
MAAPGPRMSTPLVQPEPAPTRLNLEIVAGPLVGGGLLVRDYLAGTRRLAPFFTGHFGDIAAYRRKAADVDAHFDSAAVAALSSVIRPLGDAAQHLRDVLAGRGYFVTTGQQPALFGGPLYTLYKALAAIRLASALEQLLERPVLALFWIGADDHDWDEASHAAAIDVQNYLRRVSVSAADDAVPLPLSERRWGSDVTRAVAEFCDLLPRTEFSDDIIAHLQRVYTPETTVAESFAATLELLLHDQRIALLSSAAPELRRTAAPVLRASIDHASEHARLLERQTNRLVDVGYHTQVTVAPDASNVMLLDEHGRDRLIRSDGGWLTRREKRPLSEAELLARLEATPEKFSPNVLLRPVVENATLPTIAYVAGPGEVSYFAQIGCLFAAFGMLPPVVVPRPSITIIEAKVRKVLDKLNVEPEACARPFHELVTEIIRQEIPEDVAAALHALRSALQTGYEVLSGAASVIDPTLAGPLTTARNNSLAQLNDSEKKITAHLRQRNEILVEQLRKAAVNLYPDGDAQERVLNPLPYLARYGPELVRSMAAAVQLEPRTVASWSGPECG